MATRSNVLRPIPGLEVVGRGIYLRPHAPYELKQILFPRSSVGSYYSAETSLTYSLPDGYHVNDSPPMPASQALNQTKIEESWERFEKQTGLDASLATSHAPFTVDVNVSQTRQLRQEEEAYYALRSSFIPLWTVYLPDTSGLSEDNFDLEIPTPFNHEDRRKYAKFFEHYGSHYVRRAWVGGKATLAFTVSKSSNMTKQDIQAGIKASLPGVGGASLSVSDQRSKEKLQKNSQCTVFGKGGNELGLAALSSLDDVAYNEWLATIKENPQVIELEAVGVWTLFRDQEKATALMQAYEQESVVVPLRAVVNFDQHVHFFEDTVCCSYDTDQHESSRPQRIKQRWPALFDVGFERVDAVFLGKYLLSPEGEDLSRKLFFFNREKYIRWDIDTNVIDPGYPRLISEGWPGVTFDRVDAVVNIAQDAVYFFKGNQYIRFDTLSHRAFDGYPEPVGKRWVGVTFDRIDAGVYWGNGKVFFFRDNQFIRYDSVMWRADPGYPKFLTSNYVEDWRFVE